MKPRTIYIIGSLLLFPGLLWMFLPHAAHQEVIVEEHSHIMDIVYGLVIVLIGLFLMFYANKLDRKKY